MFPLPGSGNLPVGSGGADPCIIVVVVTGNSVLVFHFYANTDDVCGTLAKFNLHGAHAAIAGGNKGQESRCTLSDAVNCLQSGGATIDGYIPGSNLYYKQGQWYR